MYDDDQQPILVEGRRAADFIHAALGSRGGVLVHCMAGVSRSVSMVLCFLMLKRDVRLVDALAHVKQRRPIACPNDGFARQLAELDSELWPTSTSAPSAVTVSAASAGSRYL